MRGLFITGTDTDVGKTWVTAAIARQLRADGLRPGVFKPACSGAERDETGELFWHDVETLAEAAAISDRGLICPQTFEAPLSPPAAARLAGRSVSWQKMLDGVSRWANEADSPPPDLLLVEGVGGLLCPLTDERSVADFAGTVGFPLVIVARLGLGTINQTLLTIEAALSRGLNIAGVILNDGENLAETEAGKTNYDELNRLSSELILGVFPFQGETVCLRDGKTSARINWLKLADGAAGEPDWGRRC
jgi:dethiobiotin synthetase